MTNRVRPLLLTYYLLLLTSYVLLLTSDLEGVLGDELREALQLAGVVDQPARELACK